MYKDKLIFLSLTLDSVKLSIQEKKTIHERTRKDKLIV